MHAAERTRTESTEPPRAGWVLAALLLSAVVCNINVVVAGIAVPLIGQDLDASQTALNLVALATGLGLSMSVLYLGALADRFGRKQLLLVGLGLTIVGSALSSLSGSIEALIAAQIFVGVAGGMAFPTTLSLITALWADGPRRTGVIAIWSSVSSMATIAGAIIGGAILVLAPWQWVFLLSAPVAVIALVFVAMFVPSHVGESDDAVDHIGGVLSAAALGSLVLGTSIVFAPGGTRNGSILLLLAVVLIALFGWRQAKAAQPLFDLGIAKQRLFWLPALGGLLAAGTLSGAMFVGGQFMQSAMGYTPLQAGLAVLPAAVSLIVAAPLSAKAVGTHGTRSTMLLGYALLLLALVSMLFWRQDSPYLLIGVGFFIIGIAVTFVMTASRRSITSSTPVRRAGLASATSDLQNDLGGSIMQALLGAVLASGFAAAFAKQISESPEAGSVTDTITHALQSSFASATVEAQQYPQYADEILAGATQSLVEGSVAAFLIGIGVILVGAIAVRIGLPNHAREREMRAANEDR